MKQLIENIIQQARAAGACDKLKGNEDLRALADLLMSPAGAEFCIQNRFPAGQTWRQVKAMGVEQYNVFVDYGELDLNNMENVAIVGRTTANFTVSGKGRRNIYAFRGASLVVRAYDWTVVRVIADPSCHIIKQTHDNAVII